MKMEKDKEKKSLQKRKYEEAFYIIKYAVKVQSKKEKPTFSTKKCCKMISIFYALRFMLLSSIKISIKKVQEI